MISNAVICFAILAFNAFFIWMQYLLYGKCFRFAPIWEWWGDFKKLGRQAISADSEILMKESRFAYWGLCISTVALVAGFVLEAFLDGQW